MGLGAVSRAGVVSPFLVARGVLGKSLLLLLFFPSSLTWETWQLKKRLSPLFLAAVRPSVGLHLLRLK